MSDQPPSEPQRSPEVETIRQLVRLMQRYDLTAIDLGDGPAKIRLRRRGAGSPIAAQATVFAPAPIPQAAATAPMPSTPPPPPAPSGLVIESPMVGTYYASPSPDAPPFVQIGSIVNEKTIVCVIEAMKVFTDIPAGTPAGISGKITEILVKNGQPVEYGQPLFRVEPA